MIERRLRREPVSRILGRKGFWKIMLNVTPDVLSPRPDTETIMDVALLAFAPHERFNVIDLGTGSGAILLALLTERTAATGVGTDISSEALAVARENAANLDLNARATFLRTEWAAGFADHSFDLVVSNPPYIPTDHIAGLDPEVREHDPHLALDGGPDGLHALPSWLRRAVQAWGVRRSDSSWVGGVLAGVAERYRVDPLLARGVFVALCVVSAGFGLLAYAVAWALLPDGDGGQTPGFQVHLGGGLASVDRAEAGLGRSVRGLKVRADGLVDYVERLVRRYDEQREPGETFARWAHRVDEEALR